jgi:SpoVK/Ycf46/Vps4 family AAA+-type ATPase
MATAYDLAYLNTSVPIAHLVDSLSLSPGGSMCLYGPPGAGKTALARHIAHTLELPVILRRGSDLLSMYVGGTEHNIAEMFEAAAAEPSVLILDEADSFLQSRSEAKHSWEITQVNELLTQMEEYDGLFICTTNLLEKLDAASLRRFDWKISFSAMTASQRWAFFLQEFHLLGGNIETARLLQPMVRQQLGGLTPGDFAPVTRQFRLLRRTPSASEFFDHLRAELTTKGGAVLDSVAFRNVYSPTEGHKDQPVAA